MILKVILYGQNLERSFLVLKKIFLFVHDILINIEEDIPLYVNSGNIMIAGDFNANTKTENDFVSDKDDNHSPKNNSNIYY